MSPADWQIEYFPDPSLGASPAKHLKSLSNAGEQAKLLMRLEVLRNRELVDWTYSWLKHWKGGVYQVRTERLRLHFIIDNRRLIVLNVFQKGSAKTERQDIDRTQKRLKAYWATKRQPNEEHDDHREP